VAAVDRLCDDAAAVTFVVPDDLADEFTFRPGQSLTVRREIDGRDERRSYSICAPAGAAPRIGVRVVSGGAVSGWLAREIAAGAEVEVAPPTGTFTPDLATRGHHVLLAAGSGITPMLSIAASLLANEAIRVTLLYGNRRRLGDVRGSRSPTSRTPTRLAAPRPRAPARRRRSIFHRPIDAVKLRTLIPATCSPESVDHWWLCGPYGMVVDAVAVLTDLGVPRQRIHQELFYVEDVPPPQDRHVEPPPGPGAALTVILDGRATELTLSYDTSVLDGAQRVRPDLPFACKGGVCGTCRARLVDGEVTMRRNFALEPAELDAGFVLTCQSYPVTDQLTVDYDA
jgi:ring-1,2-phenylacetyl-CoA epoxidase subunit PaaE